MTRRAERQSVATSAVPAAPAALGGFCVSCPPFSYCFFYFVLSWNTHLPWKIFSTQRKGCVLAQAGATGWTSVTVSPDSAVNEVPLLLHALYGGEAEAEKGTHTFPIRPTSFLRCWIWGYQQPNLLCVHGANFLPLQYVVLKHYF